MSNNLPEFIVDCEDLNSIRKCFYQAARGRPSDEDVLQLVTSQRDQQKQLTKLMNDKRRELSKLGLPQEEFIQQYAACCEPLAKKRDQLEGNLRIWGALLYLRYLEKPERFSQQMEDQEFRVFMEQTGYATLLWITGGEKQEPGRGAVDPSENGR